MKITVALLLAVLTWVFKRSQKGDTTKRPRRCHNKPSKKSDHNGTFVYPVAIQPSAQDEQWHKHQKDFWERQIRVAKYLNWITGAAAGAGIAGLCVLYFTLKATQEAAQSAKKSADTAREELRLSERPWISYEVGIVKPLIFDQNGMAITLRFSLTNVGHSPAAKTWINGRMLVISDGKTYDPLAEQKKLCEPLRKQKRDFPIIHTLFPNQRPIYQDMTFSEGATVKDMKFIMPTVIGCVDYRFEFEEGHHQTGFIWDIMRKDPAYPGAAFAILPEMGNVPVINLMLVPGISGSGDAD